MSNQVLPADTMKFFRVGSKVAHGQAHPDQSLAQGGDPLGYVLAADAASNAATPASRSTSLPATAFATSIASASVRQ